ncbi:MORN repeat variant [Fusobacterium polymorphum]|uniref:Uncharacterized protein n=3 Tax=Fusobacterium TaxID=848 RepID=A0A3P1VVK0_FUSNU|nr:MULTISPECIES: hypothetical protein [Fusobacterium]ALM94216.1 hypothetical protein RO02_06155 [Fusobacterium polymorphum]EDK89633.1 hypothetical protein FNP_1861 [Fusobacterium polymorphum ATCC 10953]PHI03809.1 hypothetical protein CBG54_12495 [Fusobacterium polymorphum]PHI16106.1 hypothetical protein CBG58_03200 [Fusobacterium polymorphum]RRD38372.1 hypothetical protein EII28_01745 [Fusobacterium nucleatum]
MENEMWRTYYSSGRLKEEVPIKRGKLNGIGILYDEDGNIVEKRIYKNDILMGNPYIGMSAEQLAEELGYIISDKSEIDLAEDDAKAVEINYKEVSKILL